MNTQAIFAVEYSEEEVAEELSKEAGRRFTVQDVRRLECQALRKVKRAFLALGISADDIRGGDFA